MNNTNENNKQNISDNLEKIELDKLIEGLVLKENGSVPENSLLEENKIKTENENEKKENPFTSTNPKIENKIVIELNPNLSKPNRSYDNLFQYDSDVSNSDQLNKRRYSNLSVSELKNDKNILKKSLSFQKDECIKIEDWEYITSDLQEFESKFRQIESKSIYPNKFYYSCSG